MKIGVDIDDTITNSWENIIPYYSKIFNIDIKKLENSRPYYYAIKDKISLEEYYEKLLSLYDKFSTIVPLKDNVKEIIDKIYEEGHTITFITARGKEHTDAYKSTKEYLDRHHIKYDKLIVNAHDKAKVCKEEKIELFIDDSIKHCTSVLNEGIDVLMFETKYNKEEKKPKHVKNWDEIYEYLKKQVT